MHYIFRLRLLMAMICLCAVSTAAVASETVAICYYRPDPIAWEEHPDDEGKSKGYALGIFHLEGDKIIRRHVIEAKEYLTACFDSSGKHVVLIEGEPLSKDCKVRIINAESGTEEKSFSIKNFYQGMTRFKNPIPQSVGASNNLVRLDGDRFAVVGIQSDAKEEIVEAERNGKKDKYHIPPSSCVVVFNVEGEIVRKELENFKAVYPHFQSEIAVDNKVLLRGVCYVKNTNKTFSDYDFMAVYATYDFDRMEAPAVILPFFGKEEWLGCLNIDGKNLYGYGMWRKSPSGTPHALTWLDWQGKVLAAKEARQLKDGPARNAEWLYFPSGRLSGQDIPCIISAEDMGSARRDKATAACVNAEAATVTRGDSIEANVRKVLVATASNGDISLYVADAGAMKFSHDQAGKFPPPRTPRIIAIAYPGMNVREINFAVENAAAYDVVTAPPAATTK